MKKPLLFLFFLTVCLTSEAKLSSFEGYFVTFENDTIHGRIKVRVDYLDELYYSRIQYGAFYEDSLGNLLSLNPNNTKEFQFFYKYRFIKFVSHYYYNNYRLFFHAINDEGPLKLYAHYKGVVDTRTDYGTLAFYLLDLPASSEMDSFFMIKPDGNSIKYNKYSGKRNISDFFSDYPQLQKKIKRGLYGYTAVYKMVREYNAWFIKNHAQQGS